MRRLAALALAAAVACGGNDPTAASVLSQTSKKLQEVRSGELSVRMDAKAGSGEGVGFAVDGQFGFDQAKALPILDMTYVERAGEKTTETAIVSTGEAAFVEVGGTTYRLPDAALARAGKQPALGGLDIERWLVDPVLEEGDDADTISAKLDAVNALNDLSSIAAAVGQAGVFPRIEGKDAEQLRATARDSTIVVTTGHDDRLLRRIELTVTLDPASPEALPAPLRALAPVTLTMTLTLAHANEPVTVTPPPTSKPYPGG